MPESPPVHHQWREISDLGDDVDRFRDRELEALCEVWTRDKQRLGDDQQVTDFNAQLAREWAIETGIIEGVYTLDRGTTRTLIERGIDSAYISHDATNRDPEIVARIMRAHAEVLEGLFSFVKGERALSTSYIKELHSALLRHQETVVVFDQLGQSFETPLEKGIYKRMANNPLRMDGTIHEYCPPEHVASEMDRMIEMYQEHVRRGIHAHIEAAWLHHAFTQIHPFQDGNGRVARSLASLVFIRSGFFPLVINRDDRDRYIDALESADRGDLSPLIRLFAQVQKRALTKAIGRAVEVRPVASVDEAIAATRDMLVDLGKIIPAEYLEAKSLAAALHSVLNNRLGSVMGRLTHDIARADSSFAFSVEPLPKAPMDELQYIGEKLKYDPNVNVFYAGSVAILKAGNVASRIVVSFHGVGSAFRGVLVASSYFQVHDSKPVPTAEDIFRISYQEKLVEISPRFQKWLDASIVEGIAQWRRTLV